MLGEAAAVARTISASERSVSLGAPAIRRSASSWPAGLARLTSVRTSTSAAVGSGAAVHARAGEPPPASTVVSENMTDIRSVAATPSTMQ